MKKIRGDKPIGVIIHIYMEISQRNFLCSYLISNKQNFHFLLIVQNWRRGSRTGPAQWGVVTSGGGCWGNWDRRVNICKTCVHMTCI
jgi:hypothetical protein